MKELVYELYKSYGIYTNTEKMVPSVYDGTIPVWKRLLLGAHTIARDQFVKSATLFGYVIGHWHPHSEALQGTAQLLVENNFLEGKGNWGSNIGIEPTECAAPRYTSLRLNKKLMEDLVFKYIDDVPWVDGELEKEPLFLPTPIPLCLFGNNEFNMIGFGIKIEIPCYKLSDLKKRLLYLISDKKEGKGPIIKPNIKGCDVISDNNSLLNLLAKKGKHIIKFRGKYEIDNENYRVYILGWSPRSTFSSVFSSISKEVGPDNVVYLDESTDKVGTRIRLEITKNRNKEKVFEKLVSVVQKKMEFSLTYQIYAVDSYNKNLLSISVDDFLLKSYESYSKVFDAYIIRKESEINKKIEDYLLIEEIRKHISQQDLIKKDLDNIIISLSNILNKPEEDIRKILNDYKIKDLLTTNLNITKLRDELKQLKNLDKTHILQEV